MYAAQTSSGYGPPQAQPDEAMEFIRQAQILSQGMEFAQATLKAANLDEAYLLLTNDIRCLVEFDRCFLITHFSGKSRFVAAGALLTPEKKSLFHKMLTGLAPHLLTLTKPMILASDYVDRLGEHDIEPELQKALKSFVAFSGANYFFCLPLTTNGIVVGHLVFEFLEQAPPDKATLVMLQKIEPIVSGALAQKWLGESKPALAALMGSGPLTFRQKVDRLVRKAWYVGPVLLAIFVAFFALPFDHTVGGEAEVVAGERHMAFTGIDGLIEHVYAREGMEVKKDQILATLDPKDLRFKITVAQRELDIMTKEMGILSDSAGVHSSKLAQAQLVELNRRKKIQELEYLKSRWGFLEITAPVSGTIITKNIQSLAGKRLAAGEPFCEIVARDDLCVDVNVPDDRITLVKPGQDVWVYLNGDPSNGRKLKVMEVAPKAEVLPRFGNIFRARAAFPDAPANTMVGMKGIGKIRTGSSSLWSIMAHKAGARWNEFSASFL